MELPRALMPWADALNLFAPELIAPFGGLVQRLDLVIGPMRAPGLPGQGEPDGFDGLTRRGDYDRLLLSEWLLAEEAPDEFLRRAAMGEHAFLEPARREPGGARVCIALFDAGPNQLGTPRLAHLAALIVLARRARAAGASFRWGVLQEEGLHQKHAEVKAAEHGNEHADKTALREEVTPGSVRHLLQARSLREAQEHDLVAFLEPLNRKPGTENSKNTTNEVWLIGGKRLQTFPAARAAFHLQIQDVLEPETRCLAACVLRPFGAHGASGPQGSGREIRLELPPDDVCARLLRDPFRAQTAEARRTARPQTPFQSGLSG